jgi:hypothetical protein
MHDPLAGLPTHILEYLREMGYLIPDSLAVGDPAPRLSLNALRDDSKVTIGLPARPRALIFGSYT